MNILTDIFGYTPRVKIIEAFAESDSEMLYIADIVRITNLSKMTVNSHINKLLHENIIQKTKKAGIIQYYQLNKENLKVNVVLDIVRRIASQSSKDMGYTAGTQSSYPYFSESTSSMNNSKLNDRG